MRPEQEGRAASQEEGRGQQRAQEAGGQGKGERRQVHTFPQYLSRETSPGAAQFSRSFNCPSHSRVKRNGAGRAFGVQNLKAARERQDWPRGSSFPKTALGTSTHPLPHPTPRGLLLVCRSLLPARPSYASAGSTLETNQIKRRKNEDLH